MVSSSLRWFDGSQIGLPADWRVGIRSMVAAGLAAYEAGECNGLQFSVFDRDEAALVHELMTGQPDVPYSIDRAV